MPSRNRRFRSGDPLDHFSDPLDQFCDPLGHSNNNHAVEVRALRKRMRLTQREFASRFGFPVTTLRHWERGTRKPAGTALVLLHVIRDNPRAVWQAVRK